MSITARANTPPSRSSDDRVVGDNPITEGAIDQAAEDSFPASDAPSHTPLTSLGPPEAVADEAHKAHWPRKRLLAGVALALAFIASASWQRRS